MKKLKLFWGILTIIFLGIFFPDAISADDAVTLTPQITTSGSGIITNMTNNSYYSMATFMKGDTITISDTSGIQSLYICWNNKVVPEWNLTLSDNTAIKCGTHGYLHEYIRLDTPQNTLTITIPADNMNICKIFAFGQGDKPSWVQDWSDSCVNADVLLVSTHADDEQLFFGGIIPYYAGELNLRVQVAYFTNYWNGSTIREHEKLDGLWTVGVKNYPVNGEFDDIYADSLESAKSVYNYDDSVKFMTELIRRFKPLVLVGQDLKGEYGHGGHMLTASAICDAVAISADSSHYSESADLYGTYDVPKTYLHLYPENSIDLDCQRQLSNFNNKTVLEVASEGYLQHVSQQWCWFYVSDTYEYSCGRFGLYRSNVGTDTSADIMCNLISYEEQESIALEEASKEAQSQSESASIAESISASVADASRVEKSSDKKDTSTNHSLSIVIVMAVLIIIFAASYIFLKCKRKNNR